jgi:UV DNA damage endonuclease
MGRQKKVVVKTETETATVLIKKGKKAVARDVSTAAAVLDAEYSVSEEESEASEALSEEVAATKQQAKQKVKGEKVEPQPPQPPAPPDPSAPLPNLGYACLNVTLRNDGKKPSVFNNRTCRLATLKEKGLEFVSGLALANCQDLLPMLQWNAAHGIKLMRLSSEFLPWGNVHYRVCELPDYEGIKAALAAAGEYARETEQRLTTHPSEYTKLAATSDEILQKTLADLELHSEMFDLLGFPPSPYNKINIHVGGTYNDKEETLHRFAANFRKLSPNCQARLTVENDDRASMYSVRDLLRLHDMCAPQLPIVFDFHHWRFCTGDMTSEEALKAAVGTWPAGIRPVVHWSESQGGKIGHAHSDYIGQQGRLNLHGMDADIDVMIESKAKELSILLYRDIVKNGNAGREMFFQGIDEIEEEAERVEAAKARGEVVELEPLPSVVLEDTEIIPVNDKRLHGRSQRRNKAQAAARAATAKPRRTKEEIEADKAQKAAAKEERLAARATAKADKEAAKVERAAAKEAAKQQKDAAKQQDAAAKAQKAAAAAAAAHADNSNGSHPVTAAAPAAAKASKSGGSKRRAVPVGDESEVVAVVTAVQPAEKKKNKAHKAKVAADLTEQPPAPATPQPFVPSTKKRRTAAAAAR